MFTVRSSTLPTHWGNCSLVFLQTSPALHFQAFQALQACRQPQRWLVGETGTSIICQHSLACPRKYKEACSVPSKGSAILGQWEPGSCLLCRMKKPPVTVSGSISQAPVLLPASELAAAVVNYNGLYNQDIWYCEVQKRLCNVCWGSSSGSSLRGVILTISMCFPCHFIQDLLSILLIPLEDSIKTLIKKTKFTNLTELF